MRDDMADAVQPINTYFDSLPKNWRNALKGRFITKPLQYTFNLPAPRVQLDYEKIASDLSYKNCIALVTAESKQDKEFVALIDSSIIQKYEHIKDSHFKPFGSTDYNTFVCIELSSESEFGDWVDWCKTVKRLPWPKDLKEQTTIKVSIPKVEV